MSFSEFMPVGICRMLRLHMNNIKEEKQHGKHKLAMGPGHHLCGRFHCVFDWLGLCHGARGGAVFQRLWLARRDGHRGGDVVVCVRGARICADRQGRKRAKQWRHVHVSVWQCVGAVF